MRNKNRYNKCAKSRNSETFEHKKSKSQQSNTFLHKIANGKYTGSVILVDFRCCTFHCFAHLQVKIERM